MTIPDIDEASHHAAMHGFRDLIPNDPPKLRLYVWRGSDVLKDYTAGIAFALAPSADRARDLIRSKICRFDESFLLSAPEVFETEVAIVRRGSA